MLYGKLSLQQVDQKLKKLMSCPASFVAASEIFIIFCIFDNSFWKLVLVAYN